MTEKTELPLFPLHTVLFPGGPVPLRVFETRYLDMVSSCLKGEGDFGVILIEEGSETGPVSLHETGTVARIRDWYQGSDGILGLTVVGERRFRLQSVARQHDGLNVARVALAQPEARVSLPSQYRTLAQVLEGIFDNLGHHYEAVGKDFADSAWVSFRLAEILPITLEQKQRCLELDDPLERLDFIWPLLESLWARTDDDS